MVKVAQPETPDGPKDRNCPLYKQPMSEVCKSCNFWMGMDVPTEGGKTEEEYQCLFVWDIILKIREQKQQDGMQTAFESLRNVVAQGMAQSKLRALTMDEASVMKELPVYDADK